MVATDSYLPFFRKALADQMLRSKATVFGVIALLLAMTGLFTATSSEGTSPANAGGGDGFILVNGDLVSESEFTNRVATVERNVVTMTAEAETAPDGDSLAEEVLEIFQETPPETIALASLVMDLALYQEAIEQGFQPDFEAIEQQVEQERLTFEMIEEAPDEFGVAEEDVEAFREVIDEIGESEYWAEYYPDSLAQQHAVQQFQMAVSQAGEDWIEVQRAAFFESSVEIDDPDAIAPATLENAGAYLDSVWDVYRDEDSGS